MGSRKRTRAEMETEDHKEPSLLDRVRNTWELASLMQYIFIFGKAVKIDEDIDIEELETECLKPTHSDRLTEIGIAMLKYVSSYKPLTHDNFDEYTRRQYVAKAPQRNPFGDGETPNKFAEMDVFTKLRVLQQLSTWTFHNPDRIRERMHERDMEQTQWRIEPFGWDAEDRSYFLLDDDRLYRRTDPPPEVVRPKAKSKPKSRSRRSKATRASKRRKVETAAEDSEGAGDDPGTKESNDDDDGFGGMKWECLAVTLGDYENIISSLRRSKDPNEKALHDRLIEEVLPIIQKRAEEQERKALRKLKELETLQKLASAKRSSRIATKMEKRKEEEEAAEVEKKRQVDLSMARKEEEKRRKMEEARESRMMTREQRVREREVKRILHEEELKRLEEDSKNIESGEGRLSERHLKSEMKRRKEELEKLQQEEDWMFDCAVCGVHGENLDDGTHSIACDKCSVWQHSACHGIAKEQAEKDDFHFICNDCKRKAEEANRPKVPPLKLRFSPNTSPNAKQEKKTAVNGTQAIPQQPRQSKEESKSLNFKQYQPSQPLEKVQINVPESSAGKVFDAPMQNGSPLQAVSSNAPISMGQTFIHFQPPKQSTMNKSPLAQSDRSNYRLSPPRQLSNGFPRPESPTRKPHPPDPTFEARQKTQGLASYNISSQFASSDKLEAPSIERQNLPSANPSQPFSTPMKHITTSKPSPTAFGTFTTPSSQGSHFQTPLKQALTPSQSFHSPAAISTSVAPGRSPEKHDSPRPISNHGQAEVPVLLPIASLSPSAKPQILTPPVKKMSPDRTSQMGGG